VSAAQVYDDFDAADFEQLIEQHHQEIAAVLEELACVVDACVDRDTLVKLRWNLREARVHLDEVAAAADQHLLAEAGERTFDVPGIGRVEIKVKKKRTGWRHDELVPALVAKAREERLLNSETGDVEPEGVTVARVLRDCISFGAGKVTGLRRRGFQPDEWCNEEPDGWQVVLPPREVTP
jgi:hypothetical protein